MIKTTLQFDKKLTDYEQLERFLDNHCHHLEDVAGCPEGFWLTNHNQYAFADWAKDHKAGRYYRHMAKDLNTDPLSIWNSMEEYSEHLMRRYAPYVGELDCCEEPGTEECDKDCWNNDKGHTYNIRGGDVRCELGGGSFSGPSPYPRFRFKEKRRED